MAKHKADGLFYVTSRMLIDNDACRTAWKIVTSKAMKQTLYDFHDAKVLVTQDLVFEIAWKAGGVANWLEHHVVGFKRLGDNISWAGYATDERIMNVLWHLAIERGLVKES